MSPMFIAAQAEARKRWKQAFPEATVSAELTTISTDQVADVKSIWLDLSDKDASERAKVVQRAAKLGPPVIAMVAVPDEADAFALLQAGAQGYCHIKAATTQLREITLVVEHGGLWMPPQLMRRFLAVSARVVPTEAPGVPRLDTLTSRELMVAEQVARGASNREIAAALNISERTVKAHLTAIFEKLDVRDRVQLALAMNNISTYATVN